jgi:hypothetical protein
MVAVAPGTCITCSTLGYRTASSAPRGGSKSHAGKRGRRPVPLALSSPLPSVVMAAAGSASSCGNSCACSVRRGSAMPMIDLRTTTLSSSATSVFGRSARGRQRFWPFVFRRRAHVIGVVCMAKRLPSWSAAAATRPCGHWSLGCSANPNCQLLQFAAATAQSQIARKCQKWT